MREYQLQAIRRKQGGDVEFLAQPIRIELLDLIGMRSVATFHVKSLLFTFILVYNVHIRSH
ncbi:hypothetical protein D3C81_907780 [compost metagenome]